MPETRGERIIFWIGIVAIAALVALIVLEKKTALFETHRAPAAPVTTAVASTDAAGSASPPVTTSPSEGETTTAPKPAAAATAVRLELSPTSDTWVEVRSGSAGGNVLYSGILTQGSVKRFRDKRLWVRFGAAANLTARLNGRPLDLPPGTYEAIVRARGLKPLGG
jgi:hypothetical protein